MLSIEHEDSFMSAEEGLSKAAWNWRLISAEGGRSRCLADIGSHWCDGVEHITGRRITSVYADIQTLYPTRKRAKRAVHTFSGKALGPEDYEDVEIDNGKTTRL